MANTHTIHMSTNSLSYDMQIIPTTNVQPFSLSLLSVSLSLSLRMSLSHGATCFLVPLAKWRSGDSGREEMTLAVSWSGALSTEDGSENILIIAFLLQFIKHSVHKASLDFLKTNMTFNTLIGSTITDCEPVVGTQASCG